MTAKLRCQHGDLALVLRGLYTGSVVTVIELADEELLDEIGVADNSRPCWVTDKPLDWGPHDEFRWTLAPDTSLMPIRPEPDPLDEERMHELSDEIGHFYQMAANGQLADYIDRIAGAKRDEDGSAR
jgi:hypothetical protein